MIPGPGRRATARVARRPRGPLPLLAAAAAVLAVAPEVGGQELETRMWLFGGVSFPARVDSFTALGTERWPTAERGTRLRYGTEAAPGATVDVHVQPIPTGRADPELVREEFQRTLAELRRYARDGVSVSVDTVHAVAVESGGWTYDGHFVAATIRRGGSTGRTVEYVFAKPPSFVKIRVTHEMAQQSVLEPRIQAFVAGILGRLESFQGRAPPGGR